MSITSTTAFQAQYNQEFIDGFEQRQSLLRDTVTSKAQIKGNQAVFLVADSGQSTAVTRGTNGLIPSRGNNKNQFTATVQEWHDLVKETGFNIFASQGDSRQIMQHNSMGVVNRKVDQDIIGELQNATLHTSASNAAIPMSMKLFLKAKTILGNNQVPWDGNITALVTPAAEAYLQQMPEFTKATYVGKTPLNGSDTSWRDQPNMYRWMNVLIIVHPNLPGVGTTSESCFMYHKTAIGHAINTAGIQNAIGYDQEQDYSYARTTVFMGTKLLQTTGVVQIYHDGSEFASV